MSDRTADVISVVASVLNVPAADVPPDASMETLPDWDSLAQLNICMLVGERFGVEMDMDAIAEATSVPALVELLAR